MIPFAAGRGLRAAGVRTRVGFGETPPAEFFAGGQRAHVLFTKHLATETVDMVHAKAVVCGHTQGDGRTYPGHFLHDDGVLHIAQSRAAVFRGNHHTKKTQTAELLEDLRGEGLGFIQMRHVRTYLVLRELADGGTDGKMVLG